MNSRIAYDLLPDFASPERPPKVVVQLHVEEPTRDGYVRYVTTRYGGPGRRLLGVQRHVGDAVVGYGISRELVEIVPTGIDADLVLPATSAPSPTRGGGSTCCSSPGSSRRRIPC